MLFTAFVLNGEDMAREKLSINFDGSYTEIYKLGCGLVLREPTVVAVSTENAKDIKAFGEDAKKLIGKTAEKTKIVFPVFECEIVNEKVASELLRHFLRKVEVNGKMNAVTALFSVPCGVSRESLNKYERVAKNAGIDKVHFAYAPLLAVIGQQIPVNDYNPYFVVDICSGTTNFAALTLDGIIKGFSLNIGANKISTDIIDYVAEVYGLQIGIPTAERLKKEIGSLCDDDGLALAVSGRETKTGLPKTLTLKAFELVDPIKKYFEKLVEYSMSLIVKLPPEVSSEIRKSGIYISGEDTTIYGLKDYVTDRTKIKTNIAENADTVKALGGGTVLGNSELLKKLSIKYD